MTALAIGIAIGLLGGGGVAIGALALRRRRIRRSTRAGRIAFPFVGSTLSETALDAVLRLARAEGATLLPIYLATVPMQLPLDTPIPKQCGEAMPLLEAIERRAAAFGVPVDSRIDRGRSLRHALGELMTHERYERLVVVAAGDGSRGLGPDDVAWLLRNASEEIVVLRPAAAKQLTSGRNQRG